MLEQLVRPSGIRVQHTIKVEKQDHFGGMWKFGVRPRFFGESLWI